MDTGIGDYLCNWKWFIKRGIIQWFFAREIWYKIYGLKRE